MQNYVNRQGNPATFETLDEVRANAPAATAKLSGNSRMRLIADPKLDDFPKDLVYIYRSPDLYGGETAARNNTSFILFADRRFRDKDEAFAYLESLGLIRLINSAVGSIILWMPEKDGGYTESDLQHCYVLINSLFSQKALAEINGERARPAESEYCGGYGKNYMFGVGAGASFMNNYVAGSREELIGRMAGYFTYGGEMSGEVRVSVNVPAFLVNPCDTALNKFREANGTDAYCRCGEISTFYDRNIPLRKVCTARDETGDVGGWMEKAFKTTFMFLQRASNVSSKYLEPAVANKYTGYVPAPRISQFSLAERNPIFNGRTVVGDLQVTFVHDGERFSDVKAEGGGFLVEPGAYLDTWYEVLPQPVLNNTAPEHSVPLLLANHGGGDDNLMFLDETGLLLTAGREGFAIVAPMHSGLTVIAGKALTRLVGYMLEKYPALDPERVYVTGYSMGGMATYNCIGEHPELFAAACPMAMPLQNLSESTAALYEKYDLPAMLITSSFDFAAWDTANNRLNDGAQFFLQTYCRFNGIDAADADYEKYPVIGRPSDSFRLTVIDGQWRNFEWLINNDRGVPMMGLNVTEYLQHSLWPGYGDIAYDFFRHYRRSAETGEIIYTK
ncbi:MAG: prolyl oligopeptidase family serine peptidase [Oscillospiraceae bacterium]|nr:prolyl oligopeptidase family serine peptidase [Oscillospiraceae bacterium]